MFDLASNPIDVASLSALADTPAAGAFVSFEGRVRNHSDGRSVDSLEYEAYAVLAVKEGDRVIREAMEQFDVEKIVAAHRAGHLTIGDVAVYVGVSAAHREAAFAACRYVIDEIKLRLPIWKREHYSDGTAEWVNCAACGRATADAHR